ncbi:MAG: alpha-galactosidase [Pirellulales bacterium]|nr:alpha-galactosidase [Pirellulales bacterium]
MPKTHLTTQTNWAKPIVSPFQVLLIAAIGIAASGLLPFGGVVFAESATGTTPNSWRLETGGRELELQQNSAGIFISKLGMKDSATANGIPMPLVGITVAGNAIAPADLAVESVVSSTPKAGVSAVTAKLRSAGAPLELAVTYAAWAETGEFTCDVVLSNTGHEPIEVNRCSSLYLTLPGERAELRYLDGSHGIERQLESVSLGGEEYHLNNNQRGRSTPDKSLWWSIFQPNTNLSYTAQMAYSGNWDAIFAPTEGGGRTVALEMVYDNGGPLRVAAGKSFALPRALLTVSRGPDLREPIASLHRYLRQYVIPKQPQNDPLLVEYNSWYAYSDKVDAEKVASAIPLAAKIGCEAFVIDANWHYCPGEETERWQNTLGDWEINPRTFPEGLSPLIRLAHDHGMKFGVWFEPEVASLNSQVLREHPDWFLTKEGKPIVRRTRVHLDYAKPEVRQRMHDVVARVMKQGRIDWVKFDYNIDIGNDFDPAGELATNTRLHDHLQGYFQWLDELAAKYPDLIIENCASGGRRAEPAIFAHTHTGWISDTTNPRFSVQCAWGALVEMPPEICNHWMVGDLKPKVRGGYNTQITSTDPRWWDFMFRIAMNGQFGISSRLDLWPPDATKRAAENITLYKRIRRVLHGSDVYHLTDAPEASFNPQGWMAIQYVRPDQRRSVILTFRLGESEATRSFPLHGLEPDATYSVLRDGEPAGEQSGKSLMKDGLTVELEKEWYSQVIELSAMAR